MSLTIYGFKQSRAFRAVWMAEELVEAKGIAYEHDGRAFQEGDDREILLALNPMGQVPVIQDDDFVLRESMAINSYLAEKYDVLQPQGLQAKALGQQWAFWAMTAVEPYALRALAAVVGFMGSPKDPNIVAEELEKLKKPFEILDGALSGTPYLLGREFTVADLNVASIFTWVEMTGTDLSIHANLSDWYARCTSRPAAKRAQAH